LTFIIANGDERRLADLAPDSARLIVFITPMLTTRTVKRVARRTMPALHATGHLIVAETLRDAMEKVNG
jgi:hypothetical protein